MDRRDFITQTVCATGAAGILPGQAIGQGGGFYYAIRSESDLRSFAAFYDKYGGFKVSSSVFASRGYAFFDRHRTLFERMTDEELMAPVLNAWIAEASR